jgi:hypothetical protein
MPNREINHVAAPAILFTATLAGAQIAQAQNEKAESIVNPHGSLANDSNRKSQMFRVVLGVACRTEDYRG